MDYLAVDFGTANCSAADVGDDGRLRLVPLEGPNFLLPSVIFIPRTGEALKSITDDEIARHARKIYQREQEAYESQLVRNAERLHAYILSNGPKKPKIPLRGDYHSELFFSNDFKKYELELQRYSDALRMFEQTAGNDYAKKLQQETDVPPSLEECYGLARKELMQERAEDNFRKYFDQTFFKVLKEEGHPSAVFGQRALDSYSGESLGGFLLRSPKAFLGIPLHTEHQELFVIAISEILRHIRERARAHTGKNYLGIVLGKPVNYMGTSGDAGNRQALDIMRRSAARAGFIETRFVIEPLAAALAVSKTILDTEDPVLIVDLGGGTTDCAFVSVDKQNFESFSVNAASGDRVGGADFDEFLAWQLFSGCLGRGTRLVRRGGLPMPTSLISDALSTRDLAAQIRFRKSGGDIATYLSDSEHDPCLERLYQVYRDQLQHKLISLGEDAKIRLNTTTQITYALDFFEHSTVVEYEGAAYSEHVSTLSARILELVTQCLEAAKALDTPVRVFLTGGMSQSQELIRIIQGGVPDRSTFQRIDPMRSVVAGLATVARILSASSTVVDEPRIVRGVRISH